MRIGVMSLLSMSLLTVLTGCVGGGGGGGGGSSEASATPAADSGDSTAPTIVIQHLGLQGTLSESAVVTVNGIADQDGIGDAGYAVEVELGSAGLPADPLVGSQASGTLTMSATDPSSNVGGHDVYVEWAQ